MSCMNNLRALSVLKRKWQYINRKWHLIRYSPFVATLFGFMTQYAVVFASADDSENAKVEALKEMNDHLQQMGFFAFIGREIGWLLTKGLLWLSTNCEKMLSSAYKLLNFTTDTSVSKWIDTSMPIVFALLFLGIIFYGVCKMYKPDFVPPIIQNLTVFIIVVCASTQFFHMGNQIVSAGKAYLTSDKGLSTELVAENTEDIYTFERYGYKEKKIDEDKYKITPKNNTGIIDYIKPTEDVDGDEDINPYTGTDCDHDFYDFELVAYSDGKGKVSTNGEAITDGMIDFLNNHYYRYNFNFFNMWIGLIALIMVYIFSSYKVIRISFELLIHKIILPFVSGGDITNGKRTRQVIQSIASNYLILLVILVIQQAFGFAFLYIGDMKINALFKVFFQVFLSISVIDAPNIIEQILGVDAGLKSAFSMFGITRAVGTIARGASKTLSTAGRVTKGVASGAAGYAGMVSGLAASQNGNAAPYDGGGKASTSGFQAASDGNSKNINVSNANETSGNTAEMNAPQEAMVNSGAGADHPNNYYIDPNTLGQRYGGSIGDFIKKNTNLGQKFSKSQSLGNALSNTLSGMNKPGASSNPIVLQGKDGATGAKGEKGDKGDRGTIGATTEIRKTSPKDEG